MDDGDAEGVVAALPACRDPPAPLAEVSGSRPARRDICSAAGGISRKKRPCMCVYGCVCVCVCECWMISEEVVVRIGIG